MLGRLLQSAASTFAPGRPQPPLESATEEAHTRELLYPEVGSLGQHSTSSLNDSKTSYNARDTATYDDRGGLNIACPRDIRIIIAQDANSRHQQPQVLYDSAPPTASPTTRQETPPKSAGDGRVRQEWIWGKGPTPLSGTRTTPRHQHARQSSVFSSSQVFGTPPTSPRSPEFRTRRTFGDLSSRSSTLESNPNESETIQGKLVREGREDTEALLSCMFGPPGFRLEPGTKLHVIPHKLPGLPTTDESSPGFTSPTVSTGFSRQRTPLIHSTSTADFANASYMVTGANDCHTLSTPKSSLLITKLFSVQLAESQDMENAENHSLKALDISSESNDPSTTVADRAPHSSSSKDVKQTKTPMFAIALILQLPSESQRQSIRKPSSYPETSSLGSSYDYTTLSPASWKANNFTLPGMAEDHGITAFGGVYNSSNNNSNNSNITKVLTHWDMVGKALASLEFAARDRLQNLLLYQKSLLAPLILSPPMTASKVKSKKSKQQTQQNVQVEPGCLQEDIHIQSRVKLVGERISGGLRTRRVITGQGRWGNWREEARWIGRWAGGRDQNFFFFNLLTAFLGSNTSWMGMLDSIPSNRNSASRNHLRAYRSTVVRQQTVIVAKDKMAARRLIFLLAAFLPNTHMPCSLESSQWTQFVHPIVPHSQSPTSIPTIRGHSRTRTVASRPDSTRKPDASGHGRSVSFSLEGADNNLPGTMSHNDKADRRVSDARSIRGASLAIPTGGKSVRKASISTVIADSAIPVPHFTSLEYTSSPSTQRPGSSGSLASIALNQSLRRSDSTGLSNASGSAGRFGSMVSGFWSLRHESSTDESDAFASSQEVVPDSRGRQGSTKSTRKLDKMIEEVQKYPQGESYNQGNTNQNRWRSVRIPHTPDQPQDPRSEGALDNRSIAEVPKLKRLPLKIAVNEENGTVDIEMPPTNSFTSSLASSFASYHLHKSASNSFHDHFTPYGRPMTPDSPRSSSGPAVEVAGWLKKYHPDFTLQAVRPYEGLEDDVQRSLDETAQAVLTGQQDTSHLPPDGRWVDVATILIADTTAFSIRRLHLRQRRRLPLSTPTSHSLLDSPIETSSSYQTLMDMDPILVDAIERVLAQSGRSSRAHSRAPSPVRSEHRSENRPGSIAEGPGLEIPNGECRRTILGALEEVVRIVQGGTEDGVTEKRGKDGVGADNTLREGIRRCLGGEEGKCKKG